jgi:hypothetical protein
VQKCLASCANVWLLTWHLAMWPGRHPFALAVRTTLKMFRRCQLAAPLFPFTICIVTYLLIGLYPGDIIADWCVHRIRVVVRCHTCQHTATTHHGTTNLYVRLQQTQTHIGYCTPQAAADILGPSNRLQPLPFQVLTYRTLTVSLPSHWMPHNLQANKIMQEWIN